jgi:D-alanyl-D-alanine carboxypeptidase/D-alanyl-D-alanine-endopeptidase (penicillin-binding protein 4)
VLLLISQHLKLSKAAIVSIVLIVIFTSLPCLGTTSSLESVHLNNFREILPRDSRWGLSVFDIKSGKETVSLGNPNERLTPASLIKLFISGAALEMESSGKRFLMTTDILHDGYIDGTILNGNIYLKGYGNCLLSVDDLKSAARFLKDKGIQKITGQVVADETLFNARGLTRTRKGAGHAPVSALGMDLHTVSVTVEPTGTGTPPRVTIEPPNNLVRFAVAGRTTASGNRSIDVTQLDDESYRITGDIPVGSASVRKRFSLSDPSRYVAGSFQTILQQTGITVTGNVAQRKTPEGASLLVSIPGRSLQSYIYEMNTNSLNVAADNLLLTLGGLAGSSPLNREMGLDVLKAHLLRHGSLDTEVTVVDGSGLLSGNKVTPRALARYLVSISRQKWFGDFRNSLPRLGLDGTVKASTIRNERFRVKTGNLENVTALAGYGVDGKGREIAYAFIVESSSALPPNAHKITDEILEYLAGL